MQFVGPIDELRDFIFDDGLDKQSDDQVSSSEKNKRLLSTCEVTFRQIFGLGFDPEGQIDLFLLEFRQILTSKEKDFVLQMFCIAVNTTC